jgi:glycosyltransferase involved in cell wall biosynthesis
MTKPQHLPGPMRVVRVDLDAAVPGVSRSRPAGGEYAGAFVVMERCGRPLGDFEVELNGSDLPAAELTSLIEQNLSALVSTAGPQQPVVDDASLPFVSVVIPTAFVRVELLARCVAALGGQDYPSFEVIVVDNRPNDSAERAAHWRELSADPRVSVVGEPLTGSAAARNRGIAVARGEILAFIDDDAVPERGWLRAIGRRFALEPNADAVTGLFLPSELETPAQVLFERSGSKVSNQYVRMSYQGGRAAGRGRFEVTATRPEDPSTPSVNYLVYQAGRFGIGANMAFRAEALGRLGGFDEAMGIGTPSLGGVELQVFIRLLVGGGRLTFDPEVVIFHSHVTGYDELRRKLYSYGCGFTGLLTSLVWADPRHLIGLSTNLWRAGRLFTHKFFRERTAAAAAGTFPSELSRIEMRGFAVGPFRYLYSRYHMRRLRRRLASTRPAYGVGAT